ncbi:dienelactone hydrolase family protein [Herbiconiux sp. L3-i23]|uniref:dienelactone hydrolase family protein n=1 Tax=Herbiconiux sp. L3-i23 TaxID=2905871 RepID=UPI002072DDB3|nr:dienelactone hydrolase family protein [Herbiconiux sp. L3-i23]
MGQHIEIDTTGGRIAAYRADPAGIPRGGIVLISEIWGLVEHIADVADRFAAEGYLVVAPDILSNAGVTPEIGAELTAALSSDDDAVRAEAQPRLRDAFSATSSPEYAEWAVDVLQQVADYLNAQFDDEGDLAVVGFCFGGTYAWALASRDSRIRLAVPFYGIAPTHANLADIHAPVLAFYGEGDERVTSTVPELAASLASTGVDFTSVVYPGVGHAFFNDTNSFTYDADAANDAWAKTLIALGEKLPG